MSQRLTRAAAHRTRAANNDATSTQATGMLENYLRGATVIEGDPSPALVLDQKHDFYRKHGLSRYSALQRTSDPPK